MAASLTALEERAKAAIKEGRKAWAFIYDPRTEPIPGNFDIGVRAMVLRGADSLDLVGAITTAAMRRSCTDRWAYTCGIVRSKVDARIVEGRQ